MEGDRDDGPARGGAGGPSPAKKRRVDDGSAVAGEADEINIEEHSGDGIGSVEAESIVSVAKKVGRPQMSEQDKFKKLYEHHKWIDSNRLAEFMKVESDGKRKHRVYCMLCSTLHTSCRLELGNSTSVSGNAQTHAESGEHMAAEAKRAEAKAAAAAAAERKKRAGTLEDAWKLEAEPPSSEELVSLQGAVSLFLSSLMPKRAISIVGSGDLPTILTRLQFFGRPLTEGVVNRAIADGDKRLRARIASAVQGKPFSLLIDEGSTRLGGRARPMCIVICCTQVGKPILLELVFDIDQRDEADKAAPVAAEAIKAAMAAHGLDLKHVTCLMGDNLRLNDVIAKLLAVPRLRCLPHCLHLVWQQCAKEFPLFCTMTRGLSSVLLSAGMLFRKNDINAAGIKFEELRCVETRWGQTISTGIYLWQPAPARAAAVGGAGAGAAAAAAEPPAPPEAVTVAIGRQIQRRRSARIRNAAAAAAEPADAAADDQAEEAGQAQRDADAALAAMEAMLAQEPLAQLPGADPEEPVEEELLQAALEHYGGPDDGDHTDDFAGMPLDGMTACGVFEVLRNVVSVSRAFKGDAIKASDIPPNAFYPGTKELPGSMLSMVKGAMEVGVKEEDRKFDAQLEIFIVLTTVGNRLLTLLKLCSANPDKVRPDVVEKVQTLQKELQYFSDETRAKRAIERRLKHDQARTDYDDNETLERIEKYGKVLSKAATAALAQYNKYFPKALAMLAPRLRYDPRREPVNVPTGADAKEMDDFFGMISSLKHLSERCEREWIEYVAAWPTFNEALKAKGIAGFWNTPRIAAAYPTLTKLANWYADYPLSNVACERVFGIVRNFESASRFRLSQASLRSELLARANGWLVQDMLHDAAAPVLRFRTTSQPATSSPSASSGGASGSSGGASGSSGSASGSSGGAVVEVDE